jgi:3-oxoacyl-[acyl-carrier-protein] synthase-3
MNSVITGAGHYIPAIVKTNEDFMVHTFYDERYMRIEQVPQVVIRKFEAITGISERRYASSDLRCSDMAKIAALNAIRDARIDPETIDQIIVAHNFGDVIQHTIQTDAVPALASRVKHLLGIENPNCVAYDILFGCPGWVQGIIQAHAFLQVGIANRCLVIGAESLSRVLDPHDRDSMIFADGAGAVILERKESPGSGILACAAQSFCKDDVDFIELGKSNFPESDPRIRFIKMKGRKVYEFALKQVPLAMQACLQKAGVSLRDVSKIFLHQANEKLDEAIVRELYKLDGIPAVPETVMPMNIQKLGNSSVATIPTLYNMVKKGELNGFALEEGEIVLFASVGAGMNINAVCYRV